MLLGWRAVFSLKPYRFEGASLNWRELGKELKGLRAIGLEVCDVFPASSKFGKQSLEAVNAEAVV